MTTLQEFRCEVCGLVTTSNDQIGIEPAVTRPVISV